MSSIVLRSGGVDAALTDPLPWPGTAHRHLDLGGTSHPYDHLWRTQPSLRTVVSFLARNAAHVGLHLYRRDGDGGRSRERSHPAAVSLETPRPGSSTSRPMTQYEWVDTLLHDLAIFDHTFWLKIGLGAGRVELRRLDPQHATVAGGVVHYRGRTFQIDQVLWISGYQPRTGLTAGCSPIESLRSMLLEEHQSSEYRSQMWGSGARISGWIGRPTEAPDWSATARTRFQTDWSSQWSGEGPGAGGTPLLEDGMEFHGDGFTAEQAQYIEARKLTRVEVASAYHVSPVMVGVLDNANYSNVREFHKILYQDTLGPYFAQIEQAVNAQLLPEWGDPNLYVEFNLREKLDGDFIDQARLLQTSVGAPIMTVNEGRARINLPSIDGGDALVVPLNVTIGGQASPTDSAPPPKSRVQVKSADPEAQSAYLAVIMGFFERQAQVLRATLGAQKARGKASVTDAFDLDRWNRELVVDLQRLNRQVAERAAAAAVDGLVDADLGIEAMLAWLLIHSAETAAGINETTLRQLVERIADGDDPLDVVDDVFTEATRIRAGQIAITEVTAIAGFAAVDAAARNGRATKTWVVTSSNPRSSHAAMHGETVPVDSTFSNGARWPGDGTLSADERAMCQCDLEFS